MSMLTDKQVEQYWKEGFLIVRNIIESGCLDTLQAESKRLWREVLRAFEGIAQIARQANAPVVVILFPRLVDFRNYRFAHLHARVGAAARQRGLGVLDLLPAFAPTPAESLKLAPGDIDHPNKLGHRLAAERIHWHLLEHRLLGPSAP